MIKPSTDDGPVLVPQPHGGALLSHGRKGGKPGPGRPPSKVREMMRGDLERALPHLFEIAANPDEKTSDRLQAIEILARYSLGSKFEIEVEQAAAAIDPDELRVRILEHHARLHAALPAAVDNGDG